MLILYLQTGLLYRAEIRSIGASVLRLPMAYSNGLYHALIVLPWQYSSGTEYVIREICRQNIALRELENSLRPVRGRAMVPKFRLKGIVDVTEDLKKVKCTKDIASVSNLF